MSNFNTKGIINVNYRFYNCKSITKLDISDFSRKCSTKNMCSFCNDNIIEKLKNKIKYF